MATGDPIFRNFPSAFRVSVHVQVLLGLKLHRSVPPFLAISCNEQGLGKAGALVM